MHIDYAKELLEYNREQFRKWNTGNPDLRTVQSFVKEKDFIKFAKIMGSEKTRSILETIEKNASNKYFKVTDKMSFAIASDILEKCSIEEIIDWFKK